MDRKVSIDFYSLQEVIKKRSYPGDQRMAGKLHTDGDYIFAYTAEYVGAK